MQHFTFILPCKTHIKKFVTATLGAPIIVDLKTDTGFVILSTLTSRLEGKVPRGSIDHWEDRYKDKLTFRIPIHYFSISKKETSPFTFVLLNRYFENLFEKEFNIFVGKKKNEGATIKKCIEDFLDQYGIDLEIDISFDAIKKSEWRYRKTLSNKVSRNLSPTLFGAERA